MKRVKAGHKKGFSIAEVMLAAFVLSVGLIGIINLMVSSLNSFFNSRDQVVASGLSQEGIELILNVRDNNLIDGESEYTGIPSANGSEFCADVLNFTLESDPALINGGCLGFGSFGDGDDSEFYLYLYEDGLDNMFYVHDNGVLGGLVETKFKRKIIVTDVDANRKSFISRVAWNDSSSFPVNCETSEQCMESEITLNLRN